MKTKRRWRALLPVGLAVLFFALAGLALGQGPILTSLPTPTPMPPPPGAVSPTDLIAQANLPDLVVEKIETVPATPLVGEPTLILVTIKNQGTGAVPESDSFFTDLYIDPPFDPAVGYHQIVSDTLGLPWGAQWFFVPPGGSYVFTTTWVFTDVKTFDLWALVDSNWEYAGDVNGNVTEVNEDNNAKKVSVSVLTRYRFRQEAHEDFLTNMASTLDNDDPTGVLRLGHFEEPPFIWWPFTCDINESTVTTSDYDMQHPDTPVNDNTTGEQASPRLIADGKGVVVAVWEDGRDGDIYNRDIYLRYSTNWGRTWGTEIRVNDDPIGNHVNQRSPVAALSEDGNLLVAWQDRRSALEQGCIGECYDIYTQRFVLGGGTLTRSGPNVLVGGSASYNDKNQIEPDIAVDELGGFHVVWQDDRNGSYDIFTASYITITGSYTWTLVRRVHDDFGITAQTKPSLEVLDWLKVTSIDYTVAPEPPYTVTVNRVISEPTQILVVAWEDDRNGDADIALVASADGGETFGVDQFITRSATDGDQQNPDVTLTKATTQIDFTVPLPDGSQTTVPVDVPTTGIHTVWEGYSTPANLDRDIYYNQSQLVVEQVGDGNVFRYILNIGGNEKINQNDARSWQTNPVDQSRPALVAIPCDPSPADPDEDDWNVFIAWADGRNYDSFNYDIYYSVKSTCGVELGGNRMLNDGIRLHNFDASNPSYDDYDAGSPPPGRQLNPSVAADIQLEGLFVSGGYLYLAWEDDRAGDPQAQKDIYFARSNLTFFNQFPYIVGYGAGSQISDVLDSGRYDTTWYTIEWTADKPASTYVTLQTRLGDTISDVLVSEWYPQRFPIQPQPWDCQPDNLADQSGAPLPGYDAPGQHIEDISGPWPQARYIQYRVNFFTRDETHTPELYDVTIRYEPGATGGGKGEDIYLPIVLR